MQRRILSIILVFSMLFSILPTFAVDLYAEQEEDLEQGTKETDTSDAQDLLHLTIEEFKEHYSAEQDRYNYLEALTLKRLGVDEKTLQARLQIEDLSFNIGNSYADSSSKEYGQVIIGLIAAGLDPAAYNGRDYIDFLANSQQEAGYFETKSGTGDQADDLAYAILALDMAGAQYDVAKAVNALKNKFTVDGDQAYIKQFSFASDGDLELTAIGLIALSNHEDIIERALIDQAANYIQAEQLSSGMYGTIDWGQEKESAKLTAQMIQALVAAGETISENTIAGLLNLRTGARFKESGSGFGQYATAEVFAALTDAATGQSMFHEVKVDVGAPVRVEIQLPAGKTTLKNGKDMQLSAQTYDENGRYVASETYHWSSEQPEVATVDQQGVVTGIQPGTATITVQVAGYNVKNEVQINVVGVEPARIDLTIAGGQKELELGRKVKVNAAILDAGDESIENLPITWAVAPETHATIDDAGILTALQAGPITITASVQKNEAETLAESMDLTLLTREERIAKALAEVKAGMLMADKYEYSTALGLKLTGAHVDDLAAKAMKYAFFGGNTGKWAKEIMMALALGKDPHHYRDKDYIQALIAGDFYNESNPESLANAIIALDMAGADYDKPKAVQALLDKLEISAGQSYIEGNNGKPNTELTALTLLALSRHQESGGVALAGTGIKQYLRSVQDEQALIENCQNHSLAIQALIAWGEDIYSAEWTKEDENGNQLTVLDALLRLKEGAQFKVGPDSIYTKDGQEVYAFAALVDLETKSSMYHAFHNESPKVYTIQIEADSNQFTLEQGATLTLAAVVRENGEPVAKEVSWESLDPQIVDVENGTIKALQAGQTKVQAKVKHFEQFMAEVTITVNQVLGTPEAVVIQGLDQQTPVIQGECFQLQAAVFDGNKNQLTEKELEWSSSDDQIASVDQNGRVMAHQVGSVELRVKIKDTSIQDTIRVTIFENQRAAHHTIDQFIEAVKAYYETDHYREQQGNLEAWETVTLHRAGSDLKKWYANKKYQPSHDMTLKYFGSQVNQALIMLDLGENPAQFAERNLIAEIVATLNQADDGYANQNYLMGVIAVDRYNEQYEPKIEYDEAIVLANIFAAQTTEGGFKERDGNPVPINTGYALKALSSHRDAPDVQESIEKALGYLQSIQKDDGAFYSHSYVTSYNAQVISGLLALGEDLTADKWSKGGANPIESLFLLWKENGSFDNQKGESINNRGWIDATQKALYTLVDLQEAGYSHYVVKSIDLSGMVEEPETPVKPGAPVEPETPVEPENPGTPEKPQPQVETVQVYTAIVVGSGETYVTMSDPKEVTINSQAHGAGVTALGALQATTTLYQTIGGYVESIFGIEARGLGGWMYTINDQLPDVYANQAAVKNGDRIIWFYSPQGMDAKAPTWNQLTGAEQELQLLIKSDTTRFKIGETVQLTAEVRAGDEVLTDQSILWSSGDRGVAIVDESGLVTARKAGHVIITATLAEDQTLKHSMEFTIEAEVEEPIVEREKIQEVLASLRHFYQKADQNFTFRVAMGYHITSTELEQDLPLIAQRFQVNPNPESASAYTGNIMGLIAAGKNPYAYQGQDYVTPLAQAQNESGKFIIGKYDDYSTAVAFSMLALDMANGKYDREKAVQALLSYQQEDGSFGGVDETAMSIMALGSHREMAGVDTAITKGVAYLQASQQASGGFEAWGAENPYSISAVIQGLIAIGEDPLAECWTKNGNTMLDALLQFQEDDHFVHHSEWSKEPEVAMATEQAFLALADLERGASIYHQLVLALNQEPVRIVIEQPASSTLKEQGKLQLRAHLYDQQGQLVLGQHLIWTSADQSIATVDQDGVVVAKQAGVVTITVQAQGYDEMKARLELTVQPEEFSIKHVNHGELKNGAEARLELLVQNNEQEAKTATLIIVLYDRATNRMLNYSFVKEDFAPAESKRLGAGFLIPDQGRYKVKSFVWHGFEDPNILLSNPHEVDVKE